MFLKSLVPGPGAYKPQDPRKELFYSFKSRLLDHSLDDQMDVPGPGAYNSV